MGNDRVKRAASQRTLIAKRFDVAITRAMNPDALTQPSKLRYTNIEVYFQAAVYIVLMVGFCGPGFRMLSKPK